MPIRFLLDSHFAAVRRDPVFWWPHVEPELKRRGIAAPEFRAEPTDGVNALFWLDSWRAIKIWSPFFGGRESDGLELMALRLLEAEGKVPVPHVVHKGELDPESTNWTWPYAIVEKCHGEPWTSKVGQWSSDELIRAAHSLGETLARLHQSGPWPELATLYGKRSQGGPVAHMQRRAADLAARPITRSSGLLAAAAVLSPAKVFHRWPVIVHADVSPEHLYVNGTTVSGLLDFGDVCLADPAYEMASICREVLHGNGPALRAFEAGYGSSLFQEPDFFLRLGASIVLHDWNTDDDWADLAAEGCETLEELGARYWLTTR